MDRLQADPRYKRAALRGAWFGAVFAVVCILLAIFSAKGLAGKPEDVSMLLVMALGGAFIFVAGIAIIKWTRL